MDEDDVDKVLVRNRKYTDWLRVGNFDEFPGNLFPQWERMHKQNTALRRLFLKHDKDGSCTLDRDEMTAMLDDLQFPCTVVEEEFEKADTDGSGEISYNEFFEYIKIVAPQIVDAPLWFYKTDDGNVEGPVPQTCIEYWLAGGQFNPNVLVRHENTAEGVWLTCGDPDEFPYGWLRREKSGEVYKRPATPRICWVKEDYSALLQKEMEPVGQEWASMSELAQVQTRVLKFLSTVAAERRPTKLVDMICPNSFIALNAAHMFGRPVRKETVGKFLTDHETQWLDILSEWIEYIRNAKSDPRSEEDVDEEVKISLSIGGMHHLPSIYMNNRKSSKLHVLKVDLIGMPAPFNALLCAIHASSRDGESPSAKPFVKCWNRGEVKQNAVDSFGQPCLPSNGTFFLLPSKELYSIFRRAAQKPF
eukprot:g3988.t1